MAKLREEIAETEAEIASGSRDRLAAEMGDLLFAAVNLARFVEIDPEAALRGANAKFERRFAHIEQRLAQRGQRPEAAEPRRHGSALAGGEELRAPGPLSPVRTLALPQLA